MSKNYKYEVFSSLDDDIRDFCIQTNIQLGSKGTLLVFVGKIEQLEKLHDLFFKEYVFKIERID